MTIATGEPHGRVTFLLGHRIVVCVRSEVRDISHEVMTPEAAVVQWRDAATNPWCHVSPSAEVCEAVWRSIVAEDADVIWTCHPGNHWTREPDVEKLSR